MDDNYENEPERLEYVVNFYGEMLEMTKGLYGPIAIVINFLMQFPDRVDVVGFNLQIFRRLYNSFPSFRKNIEDPLISCLFNVLKILKNEIDKAKRVVLKPGEDMAKLIERDIAGKEN